MELLGREDIGSSRYANARYNRAELSRTCTQASCVVRQHAADTKKPQRYLRFLEAQTGLPIIA